MLTTDDIDLLVENIPEIKISQPWNRRLVKSGLERIQGQPLSVGVTSQYKNFTVLIFLPAGFINNFDDRTKAKVIVVDETFAKRYFNRTDIVGETVYLKVSRYNSKVKIVGVTSSGDDFLTSMAGDQIPACNIYACFDTTVYDKRQST